MKASTSRPSFFLSNSTFASSISLKLTKLAKFLRSVGAQALRGAQELQKLELSNHNLLAVYEVDALRGFRYLASLQVEKMGCGVENCRVGDVSRKVLLVGQ